MSHLLRRRSASDVVDSDLSRECTSRRFLGEFSQSSGDCGYEVDFRGGCLTLLDLTLHHALRLCANFFRANGRWFTGSAYPNLRAPPATALHATAGLPGSVEVTSATVASWVSSVSSVPCVVGRGCPWTNSSRSNQLSLYCRNDSTTHTDLAGLAEHSSAQHNQ